MGVKVPEGYLFSSRFILPALAPVASPGEAIMIYFRRNQQAEMLP
jgi:hypothetical protein